MSLFKNITSRKSDILMSQGRETKVHNSERLVVNPNKRFTIPVSSSPPLAQFITRDYFIFRVGFFNCLCIASLVSGVFHELPRRAFTITNHWQFHFFTPFHKKSFQACTIFFNNSFFGAITTFTYITIKLVRI